MGIFGETKDTIDDTAAKCHIMDLCLPLLLPNLVVQSRGEVEGVEAEVTCSDLFFEVFNPVLA